MAEIAGVFTFNGFAQNSATAKLWKESGFATPPEMDEAEPAGAYQVGSTVTTGLSHGGDGAFRFVSVPAGTYYVSVEYDGHRVFMYADEPLVESILTAEGDLLVKGASGIECVAIGAEGTVLRVASGMPVWL